MDPNRKFSYSSTLSFFIVLLILPISSFAQTTKVACVGNSITYGAGMANREKNAYPVQLQALLGEDYEVKNFGLNGTTLLRKGNRPYWESSEYKAALDFVPDLVYVMLGTNDSKGQNRIYLESDFAINYKDLIASFQDVNKKARIVLLLPPPSFNEDTSKIWDPVIRRQIIPLTKKVAYDEEVGIIDLHHLFVGEPGMFPDKIHPSSLGAERIARRLYEDASLDLVPEDEIKAGPMRSNLPSSNFHGFMQLEYKVSDVEHKLVLPKRIAVGKPWVIRARFFGHEPQTDIALLERGFHIAYCDVSNLFGNEEAVERWNALYRRMVEQGFSKKVVLEGMSRGGLIIYNWAAANPEKVACIYADAPVLDGMSWPGGLGKGKGSQPTWVNFKKNYDLDTEADLDSFKGNPIHKVEEIVKGGYPMLHVCGEADDVVPVDENTRPFEAAILAEGGDIESIYKKGVSHHPHSLENPTKIVDFILRATDRKVNYTLLSLPAAEYRSAAGWIEGKGWWFQMEDIEDLCMKTKNIDLLLVGNSITQGWGGGRQFTTHSPGQTAAEKHFDGLSYVGGGISGDRVEHINYRLEKGNYNANQPAWVSLAIGVNNFRFNTADEIIAGLKQTITLTKKAFPDSKIIFFGPLPTGLEPSSARRLKYDEIHRGIQYLEDDSKIIYLNAITSFTDKNGFLNDNLYSQDGIHLKSEGYQVWGEIIRDTMARN